MEITTRTAGDVTIFSLAGRFDNYAAPALAAQIEEHIQAGSFQLLVDLSGINFVDSTGLATLVQAMKRCRQHNGDLALCGLQRSVFMIFELTRLDKAFLIYVDEEHALRAFTN